MIIVVVVVSVPNGGFQIIERSVPLFQLYTGQTHVVVQLAHGGGALDGVMTGGFQDVQALPHLQGLF